MTMRFLLYLCLLAPSLFSQSVEKAEKLAEENRIDEAVKILNTIDDDNKEYAEARYSLGRIAFDKEQLEEASDYFEEAIEADGTVAKYYNWYGNSLGRRARTANVFTQGMLAPKMKTAWEKAIELDPSFVEPRQNLVQYYLQAPSFMGGGADKAKEIANGIMKVNAAEGHRQMGNIFVYEKNIAAAEKEYIAMVAADQTLVLNLSNFYLNQKLYEKCIALLENEFKKKPNDMSVVYQLGKVSALSGLKLDQGEECLKKYLTHKPTPKEPSHAGANMRLAQIMEKRGNKVEAKKLFELAVKLEPNLKEAKEGLERVSK